MSSITEVCLLLEDLRSKAQITKNVEVYKAHTYTITRLEAILE